MWAKNSRDEPFNRIKKANPRFSARAYLGEHRPSTARRVPTWRCRSAEATADSSRTSRTAGCPHPGPFRRRRRHFPSCWSGHYCYCSHWRTWLLPLLRLLLQVPCFASPPPTWLHFLNPHTVYSRVKCDCDPHRTTCGHWLSSDIHRAEARPDSAVKDAELTALCDRKQGRQQPLLLPGCQPRKNSSAASHGFMNEMRTFTYFPHTISSPPLSWTKHINSCHGTALPGAWVIFNSVRYKYGSFITGFIWSKLSW